MSCPTTVLLYERIVLIRISDNISVCNYNSVIVYLTPTVESIHYGGVFSLLNLSTKSLEPFQSRRLSELLIRNIFKVIGAFKREYRCNKKHIVP